MKYNHHLILLIALFTVQVHSQYQYERLHRIKKSQFPESAHEFISDNVTGARKLRFYKETDSNRTHFELHFKKDRLRYSMAFDKNGLPRDVAFWIREVDIPNEVFERIGLFLQKRFDKYRIRKIRQQYPFQTDSTQATTLRNAFQNLLLPALNYELIVAGKRNKSSADYKARFDFEGNSLGIRKSVPANYDHVLY